MVHVIDAVLLPSTLNAILLDMTTPPSLRILAPLSTPTQNIPSLVSLLPELSTLLSLLSVAGLVDALSIGELTVFAPTNDAFAKLPEALISFLTRPENKQTLVTNRL